MSRIVLTFLLGLMVSLGVGAQDIKLLNVSYDPTRELYKALNKSFIEEWNRANPGKKLSIDQSHGGSGKQARAILDGLNADVATLALAYDIDILADSKLLPQDWQKRLSNNSSPYTSTIVFLVRKGNPKNIKDWNDLIRSDVKVITPNPKTSGGARWNYLAAWGYELKRTGSQDKAKEFVKNIYKNVPVLDTGARGSTLTFAQKKLGDVIIVWENEGKLILDEFPKEGYQVVVPSISILAEPPVAVVDKNAEKRGTKNAAEDYLKWLYTPQAQEIIAKNFYRPTNPEVQKKYAAQFPKVQLFTIQEVFGTWRQAQKTHFDDGGIFDSFGKK